MLTDAVLGRGREDCSPQSHLGSSSSSALSLHRLAPDARRALSSPPLPSLSRPSRRADLAFAPSFREPHPLISSAATTRTQRPSPQSRRSWPVSLPGKRGERGEREWEGGWKGGREGGRERERGISRARSGGRSIAAAALLCRSNTDDRLVGLAF
eukprot:scaffold47821_cov29-Tisochrysis_lutea.AAC.1